MRVHQAREAPIDFEVTRMNDPTTCPCCGVVVMPREMSYDFDGETVASLTREVAYLRATVARLRGAPVAPVFPAPRAVERPIERTLERPIQAVSA